MSQQPISVGENFKLKSLSDPTINLNAYYQGFVNIDSVEPSLGLPSNNTFTSPNSTYYFPVVTVHPTYGSSRKFTNNANLLTINKNNIGVGTATPNSKLTVVGDISARGRLYAEDRPYTMLFALSSIKATQGDNVIYTGIVTVPLYSNIAGGSFNSIDYSLYSAIAGGLENTIGFTSHASFIGGGIGNTTSGYYSSIVGGECNSIVSSSHSTIVGGYCNTLNTGSSYYAANVSVIVGGKCNTIMGYCGNFIGGGVRNFMDENSACGSILGGVDNCMINGEAAVILGGARNKIHAIENGPYPEYDELTNDESYSFIGTGSDNYIAGIHSAILAGRQNSLSGSNSFILGSLIKTDIHNTTFVNNLSSQGILHGTSLKALTAQFESGIFENNLTVFGNLSVLGTTVEINTTTFNTSSLKIINPGVGPALYVQQVNSNYDVAQFFTEYNIPVLTIKNSYGELPDTARVGINTDTPNKELTVIGDISASGRIYGIFDGIDKSPYKFSDSIPTSIIPISGNNSIASGIYANIGGGFRNTISDDYSTIGGGLSGTASGYSSTVAGGRNNIASGSHSTIAGGRCNIASDSYSTVGGGRINTASNGHSTVGGGQFNTASNLYSTVGGGRSNTASGLYSNVAGGRSNIASGSHSTIAGGRINTASGNYSNVAGGRNNIASGLHSTIAGGLSSTASGLYSNVAGGRNNIASGNYSIIGGGCRNTASGSYSFIAGGCNNNTNTQSNTFILGSNITASVPNYTYVNNLSVQGGLISSPGSETIISDGIGSAGNGAFTLSLNFANGVYVQNDLYLGNGSNNFDAKIQSNVTANRTFGLPDSTGTFVVATSGIRNFAAPIASSNVATVSRTIQVFDSTGTSIGFIPLYASRS
jgi:hypothetical protein